MNKWNELWDKMIVNIACERELRSFEDVAAVALWRFPTNNQLQVKKTNCLELFNWMT